MGQPSQIMYLKVGDRGRDFAIRCTGANGAPQDLTGASIKFRMTPIGSDTPKVNNAAASADDPPTDGIARYAWQAADVDTPGEYDAEMIVELGGPGGPPISFPTGPEPDNYVRVVIQARA